MTLCVLGAGAFGSALAITLAKTSKMVVLWSRSQKFADTLQKTRKNKKYLLKSHFSPNISITHNIDEAVKDAEAIIICIPAQKVYHFLYTNYSKLPKVPIILCSKGIDERTSLLQSQVVKNFLNHNKISILTGPSFANELSIGLPTALTLACKHEKVKTFLQKTLTTPNLRVYSSDDIIGAQLGGALKNVIAIGCGMVKGAGLGESASTALMTRGLSEIINLGIAMGAEAHTFYGLSGLGDLALTCSSTQSRNLAFGLNYNDSSISDSNGTIEGVRTASAANNLAKAFGIEVPIINTVDLILKNKVSIRSSIDDLLSRPLKTEYT